MALVSKLIAKVVSYPIPTIVGYQRYNGCCRVAPQSEILSSRKVLADSLVTKTDACHDMIYRGYHRFGRNVR